MSAALARTCWRAVQVDHPPEWEVVVACGPDDPGRLTLADRYFHRLDMRWRALKYVPNMDLMLSKYKQRSKEDKSEITDLKSAPLPWRGVVHKTPRGVIVHAGRFFKPARLLVEVAIIWPERRDLSLESTLLSSIAPVNSGAGTRLWQAMGLSVTSPSSFHLRESSLKVGRIQWNFSLEPAEKVAFAGVKRRPQLSIERVAVPHYWLKGKALGDWLGEQLPDGWRRLRRRIVPQGPHSAEELISVRKTSIGLRLRGYHQMRLDLAWRCPLEGRVYHVSFVELRRNEEIHLPSQWQVHCCRPVPIPGVSPAAGSTS